jgi:adenosine deaminase
MPSENLTLAGFLRATPKVEIRCRLLGTVRHATFVALAERNRAPLERAEIDGFYSRGEKPVGM